MERKEGGKKETTTRRTSIRHRRLVLSKPTGSRLPVFFFSVSPTQFLCMCVCIYKRHRDTSSQRTEINNNMLLLPLLPLVSPYSSTSSHRSRQLSTRPSLAYTCDTVFCECMYFRDFPEQKKVDRSRGG
jgi:hypothetical protein